MFKKIFCVFTIIMLILFSTVSSVSFAASVYKANGATFLFNIKTGKIMGFSRVPKDLVIPSTLGGHNVLSIGEAAFAGNKVLETLSIPESVTVIGKNAFNGCSSLRSVEIGINVSSIGSAAFANCGSLINVSFLGVLENIESDAFYGAPWLNRTDIEYLTVGNTTLLRYNGSDEVVYLPSEIKHIAPNAFAYNTNIKTVFLPEGLRSIGNSAFVHCYNLSSVYIPKTVSEIGAGAFDDTIWLNDFPGDFVSANGILISYKGLSNYAVVPHGITGIGAGAFMGNDYIKEVIIPESTFYIDPLAFSECSSLLAVHIPASVEWIGAHTFTSSPLVTVFAPENSYAMNYAHSIGLSYSPDVFVACNGKSVNYTLTAPVIHYGRTFVPATPILEELGFTVSWDGDINRLTAVRDDRIICIYADGTVSVNWIPLSTVAPPLNRYDCWLISARILAEAAGAQVEWNEDLRIANIIG